MDEKPSLRILIVDDERPIRRFLMSALGSSYSVFEAETGMEALQKVAVNRPDLIIMDLGLPDLDGVEVTRRLREWTLVPIIVVSVRDREDDKISALDAGADDYLTKPFSAAELMARMRAALRHNNRIEDEPYFQSGDLVVNLALRQVLVGQTPIALTPIEYEIMRTLVTHAGRVLTHAQIIRAVWSGNDDADAHLLRVNISNLRKKIEKDHLRPLHIITEPGVGFRLTEAEAQQ